MKRQIIRLAPVVAVVTVIAVAVAEHANTLSAFIARWP